MTDSPSPLTEEELAQLPIFPLPRVVFFPDTSLPLYLFEPRYRTMIEDCMEKGPQAMAVSLARADAHGQPSFSPIAGAGRIIHHQANADGTHNIVLAGTGRVSLQEIPVEGLPYRVGRATPRSDVAGPGLDAAATLLMNMATQIAGVVRRQHAEFELGVGPGQAPARIANIIADRFVADAAQRQAILEADDLGTRIDLVVDALGELLAMISAGDTPS